jgi:beta-glucanase (GH16 family)
MEFPGGADQGHGYGFYEIRVRHSDFLGNGSGVASLTWPADDVWPGAEEDMGEIGGDGTFYMAHHWNNNGNDAYEIFPFQHFNPNTWRTYQMRLKRDFLEYFVDGVSIGSTRNNVIRVYGDGPGYTVNRVFGVMIRSDTVWLECDWMRFTPEGPT